MLSAVVKDSDAKEKQKEDFSELFQTSAELPYQNFKLQIHPTTTTGCSSHHDWWNKS